MEKPGRDGEEGRGKGRMSSRKCKVRMKSQEAQRRGGRSAGMMAGWTDKATEGAEWVWP